MRRTIHVHRQPDADALQIRRGEDVLGTLGAVETGVEAISGRFTHRPAWQDSAELFEELARRLATSEAGGAAAPVEDMRAVIEAHGIHVHHLVHDMRVDEPGTLVIEKGGAHFRPTAAFLSLRTGGH